MLVANSTTATLMNHRPIHALSGNEEWVLDSSSTANSAWAVVPSPVGRVIDRSTAWSARVGDTRRRCRREMLASDPHWGCTPGNPLTWPSSEITDTGMPLRRYPVLGGIHRAGEHSAILHGLAIYPDLTLLAWLTAPSLPTDPRGVSLITDRWLCECH